MGVGVDLWNQFETLLSKQDISGVAALFAIDGVYSHPGGHHEGRAAILAVLEEAYTGVSGVSITTLLVLENDEAVVAEYRYRSNHAGTDKTLDMAGVSVCKVRDGKFLSLRDYYDSADVKKQLSG
jgi:uncharacterized protein (TIGR02246 family)